MKRTTTKNKPRDRRAEFVRLMIEDPMRKPADAAREAGYKHPPQMATRLTRIPEIAAKINGARAAANAHAVEKAKLTMQNVVNQLAFVVEVGSILIPRRNMSGNQERTKDGLPAFKMNDSNAVLEATKLQAKILGMLDKKEQKAEDDGTTGVLYVQPVETLEEWTK